MNDWMDRCRKYTFVDGKTGFQINFAGMKFQDSAVTEMAERFSGGATKHHVAGLPFTSAETKLKSSLE